MSASSIMFARFLGSLHLRTRLLWLAVLPLVVAIGAIGALMWAEMHQLETELEQIQEQVYLEARREELRNYIALALTSISHLYGSGRDDDAARAEARDILRAMNFGDDGYFFVYDVRGRNLVHPRQPHLQGRDLWNLRDRNGVYVIRELIARAQEGGGFQRYDWLKPSTGEIAPKLGYAVLLERWGWMLGTGLYLDDIEAASARMRASALASVRTTLFALAAVAVVAALVVFAGGMALNISEQRLADRKIRALADRVVRSQEDERARLSRELHDHICQLLVSIKYRFETAGRRAADGAPEAPELLRAATRELAGAIGEVRRLSHDLRPALLDDLGLAAALHQLGAELQQRSALTVRVQADDALPPLAPQQQADLFRIAQQALGNVEQHAQATQVDVQLRRWGDGGVLLRIEDDGRGFDVRRVQRSRRLGIGLTNMRQRAEGIGATLEIASQPGGTRVDVVLAAAGQVPGASSAPQPAARQPRRLV
jgi:two-component system NarL family sensor kinase